MWRRALIIAALLASAWGVLRAQKPFREYPAIEYGGFPLPPDFNTPHEFVWARLRYPDPYGPTIYWSMDYPRADRHVSEGIRRLSRVDARSAEQVVDPNDPEDIYYWPFLYASEAGHWELPPHIAARLRDYLQRGGFLMFDDFHGEAEWEAVEEGVRTIFPEASIEELPNESPIFGTVYDLKERIQVPGFGAWSSGVTYEKGGVTPHWRALKDKNGRILMAFCHNMDLGDAWEHSDDPAYPEKMASVAYRIAMNYIVYDLTH